MMALLGIEALLDRRIGGRVIWTLDQRFALPGTAAR
jgi:hypothetical protein